MTDRQTDEERERTIAEDRMVDDAIEDAKELWQDPLRDEDNWAERADSFDREGRICR